MAISIVGTILGICSPCCIGFILGAIAIFMSTQVTTKYNAGDYVGALSSSKNAKVMAYIAIGLGIIGIIINIVSYVIMGQEGFAEFIENYVNQIEN